jgi:hypothetical protein
VIDHEQPKQALAKAIRTMRDQHEIEKQRGGCFSGPRVHVEQGAPTKATAMRCKSPEQIDVKHAHTHRSRCRDAR